MITLATAGCGLLDSDDGPAGMVSVGIGEPAHLLPSNVRDVSGAQVLSALFTPLMTYNSSTSRSRPPLSGGSALP